MFKNYISDKLKREILKYGPCKPEIDFPVNDSKRKFSKIYYYVKLKNGTIIPRPWLCYSVIWDMVYCETCWLFSDKNNCNLKKEWVEGINDWQHLSQKINIHEFSLSHLNAMKVRSTWTKNLTIDKEFETQISKEAKFWRDILTRIVKIILTLTAGNTALRGNEGKQYSEGNFLRTVKLVVEFDPILKSVFDNEKKYKIKYLSPTIQNELIDILASNVRQIICNEISTCSSGFSIIMDSTQDITKVDQDSIIIRYVITDHEKHVLQVQESFIGFYKIDQHGAQDYENLIYKVLSDTNLDIKKCKGQGYDGASDMKGMYSGVQKRIIGKAPNATYVHCCAHNLNLVVCDAAKSSSDALRFFETIQSIFNFFSSSAPRWALLAFGNETKDIRKKTLKKLCPTRWEARHKSLFALKERFVDVLKSLSMILLTSHKSDEKLLSKSFKNSMESFEFVLMICLWENILRYTQCVSKMLQSQNINIQSACTFLDQAYQSISNLRDNFKDILNTAELICSKWNISTDFKTKRQAFAKHYFDEVDGDRRLNTTKDNFKVKVFFPIIDTVLFQIRRRFEGLYEVASTFSFLNPSSLKENNEADIIKASYDFTVKYDIEISSDFTRQVLSFKSIINQIELPNILSMVNYIIENDLSSSFPDIITACSIFLTIPVTVASAERSFSKLKLVKNYLRNTISQERLNNISILNIERERTEELNIDQIINNFANQKARKKNFKI